MSLFRRSQNSETDLFYCWFLCLGYFLSFCSTVGLCLLFILGASNVTEKMTVHSHWIVLLLVSVAGLIGGMFSRKVVYLALIEIGLLFGLAIALIFLLVGFASIVYDYARLGYFAVLLGVCGWLAYMREKHLLIVGSALPGALSIMVGIDVFAQTGLAMKMFQALALVRFYPQDVSPAAWGLLAVSFVLFAFGCVVQSLPVFPLTPTMDRHDRPTMGYWPWSVPTMRMPWPIPKAPPPMSSPPAVMPLPHH
jgi:hypothetical protein